MIGKVACVFWMIWKARNGAVFEILWAQCRMPRQSLSRAPELHVASSHETWNSSTCGFSNLTKVL